MRIVNSFWPQKRSVVDVRLGSKYTSATNSFIIQSISFTITTKFSNILTILFAKIFCYKTRAVILLAHNLNTAERATDIGTLKRA